MDCGLKNKKNHKVKYLYKLDFNYDDKYHSTWVTSE
jgi:hypothetical protein